jgi:hypothetical protein
MSFRSAARTPRARKFRAIAIGSVVALTVALVSAHAFQRPFREYPGMEYNDFPLPDDWQRPAEFTFARLMYPQLQGGFGGFGNWLKGGTMWSQDYPRADRHFLRAVRRLTRIDSKSVEQPVNLDDDDDVYNWPWLYAVQVGRWNLTPKQAAKLRDYLDRGGFFMTDDFWGDTQWEIFARTMTRVYPDRPIVELENAAPILHSIYDLDNRYQVPGARYIYSGDTEKCDNCPPHWRAIYDDKGRVASAMTFDSDLGDSWEWADDPRYEERFSALGIRIAINYIAYAMTH